MDVSPGLAERLSPNGIEGAKPCLARGQTLNPHREFLRWDSLSKNQAGTQFTREVGARNWLLRSLKRRSARSFLLHQLHNWSACQKEVR